MRHLIGIGLAVVLSAAIFAGGWAYGRLFTHNLVSEPGLGFEKLGISGVLGAAGVVLVMPLFFPSRWRRPAGGDARGEDAPIEATTVTSPSTTGLIAGLGSSTWGALTSENPSSTTLAGRPAGELTREGREPHLESGHSREPRSRAQPRRVTGCDPLPACLVQMSLAAVGSGRPFTGRT
jgi:hypothetical protein